MKNIYSDKLQVKVDDRGRPLAFSLGAGGRYPSSYKVVNILKWWREPGQWWDGEPVTLYLRLQAVTVAGNGGSGFKSGPAMPRIFELCRVGKDWYFHRVLG